ncbi:MAG: hypothetical protein Q9214_008001, partial [Letrouitia sp. 1 TL-2023]
PEYGPGASLANTLRQNTWSKLAHLELEGFDTELSGLVAFLARQLPTLRYVNLRELQIWNYSSRESVIQSIQSLTPKTIVRPGLHSDKRSIPLVIDYVFFNGEAELMLRGYGLDDEDDYDEDQVSSYSRNESFGQEEEERWSSEEFDTDDYLGYDSDSED